MRPGHHRNQHLPLWRAIDGAIRDAMTCHPDIRIPDRRIASITKRAVGSVLALEARAARQAAATAAPPPAGAAATAGAGAAPATPAGDTCAGGDTGAGARRKAPAPSFEEPRS